MPWLARYNPEIDWRTGEVKMTAHSIIIGDDSGSEDACYDDDDHYDFMGYGIDFEECANQFYD